MVNIIFNSCHTWSRLCVSFKFFHVLSLSACVFFSIASFQRSKTLHSDWSSLTHGKIFVKFLLEGSNATNYLYGSSQPSHRLDRQLWPQQTWGPSNGLHICLLLKGEVDGLRCGYGGCKAYSQIAPCTVPASDSLKLHWWHRSARSLQMHKCTVIFSP